MGESVRSVKEEDPGNLSGYSEPLPPGRITYEGLFRISQRSSLSLLVSISRSLKYVMIG